MYFIFKRKYGGLTKIDPVNYPVNSSTGLGIGDTKRMTWMFAAMTLVGAIASFFLPWYDDPDVLQDRVRHRRTLRFPHQLHTLDDSRFRRTHRDFGDHCQQGRAKTRRGCCVRLAPALHRYFARATDRHSRGRRR